MKDKNINYDKIIRYPPKHFLKIEKKYIELRLD